MQTCYIISNPQDLWRIPNHPRTSPQRTGNQRRTDRHDLIHWESSYSRDDRAEWPYLLVKGQTGVFDWRFLVPPWGYHSELRGVDLAEEHQPSLWEQWRGMNIPIHEKSYLFHFLLPLVLPVLLTESVVYHTCKNLLSMSPLTAVIVSVNSQITSIIGRKWYQILGQQPFCAVSTRLTAQVRILVLPLCTRSDTSLSVSCNAWNLVFTVKKVTCTIQAVKNKGGDQSALLLCSFHFITRRTFFCSQLFKASLAYWHCYISKYTAMQKILTFFQQMMSVFL